MYEAAASCKDIARAPVTTWEPQCVTLAGYCYGVRHGMKVQLVTPYHVTHGVTVRSKVTSVYPPLGVQCVLREYCRMLPVLPHFVLCSSNVRRCSRSAGCETFRFYGNPGFVTVYKWLLARDLSHMNRFHIFPPSFFNVCF